MLLACALIGLGLSVLIPRQRAAASADGADGSIATPDPSVATQA
jgi:hypothetical protein